MASIRELYPRAMGLNDNPFAPVALFDGITELRLLDNLHKRPLRIDLEPHLLDLFEPDAGPFERHRNQFRELLELGGYSFGEPTALGIQSFAFRVVGPQGSGKSTFVNVLIHDLQTSAGSSEFRVDKLDFGRRLTIDELVERIRDTSSERGDRCCLVIDNVHFDHEDELVDLFDELVDRRTTLLFLLMSDPTAFRSSRPTDRIDVHEFQTESLTATQAGHFLRRRLNHFRSREMKDRCKHGLELFPFDAEDLGAVTPSGNTPTVSGAVTLRTLSHLANKGIGMALRDLPPAFDASSSPDDSLKARLIRLSKILEEEAQSLPAP